MKPKSPNPLKDRDFFMSIIFIVWAANTFPDTFRLLTFNFFGLYKNLSPTSESILVWFFIIICSWVMLRLIKISNEEPLLSEDGSDLPSVGAETKVEFIRAKHKLDLQRAVFSLGLIPVRDFILSQLFEVWNYGTFKAARNMSLKRSVFTYLDIITYKKEADKPSIRYLYARNFKYIYVSKAERYEPFPTKEEKRFPNVGDALLLIVASNFFLIWFPIALLMWPYHTVRRFLRKVGTTPKRHS